MNAPGRNFIKYPSIFGIVFGTFDFVLGINGIILILLAAYNSATLPMPVDLANISSWHIISILHGAFRIFMGIMGIAYCDKIVKAKILIVIAIIDLVLILFPPLVVFTFRFYTPIYAPIPILYLIGAVKNKKMR